VDRDLRRLLLVLIVTALPTVAAATSFEEGLAAYRAGRHHAAFPLLLDAAEKDGSDAAQSLVAVMYANGQGVAQNFAEALKWNRLAAGQGNDDAEANLGLMHQHGQGVGRDIARAVKWYNRAAAQNHVLARRYLGLLYDRGDGVPKDQAAAAEWFRLAAEQGDAVAQQELAYLYFSGQGVEADSSKAFKWYRKVAAHKWADLLDFLDEMKWILAISIFIGLAIARWRMRRGI